MGVGVRWSIGRGRLVGRLLNEMIQDEFRGMTWEGAYRRLAGILGWEKILATDHASSVGVCWGEGGGGGGNLGQRSRLSYFLGMNDTQQLGFVNTCTERHEAMVREHDSTEFDGLV